MLVAFGSLTVGGRQLGRGDPVPEAEDWPFYIREIHLKSGALRDIPLEEAEKLFLEARAADRLSGRRRLEQSADKARVEAAALASQLPEIKAKAEALRSEIGRAEQLATRAVNELSAYDAEEPEFPFPDYYAEARASREAETERKSDAAKAPDDDAPEPPEWTEDEIAEKLRDELRGWTIKDLRDKAEALGRKIPKGIRKAECVAVVAEAIEDFDAQGADQTSGQE